jgi:fructuronate reductase
MSGARSAMALARLHPERLHGLDSAVRRPRYARERLQPGIVHLGIGAFVRAHLAMVTDDAIEASGDLRWGIVGVSLRQADTRDALAPQHGLYALAERDADAGGQARQRLRVIGCLLRVLVAPEEPAAVLQAIAHADTRIVSLTITEKGYADSGPGSALQYIVDGLAERQRQQRAGITLLSLDNLPSNGAQLARRVREAAAHDRELLRWIDTHCSFPNSMVDRIVPRTTPADVAAIDGALGLHDAWPVLAEPFFDWAVEDRFAAERPPWSAQQVRCVDDAAPWEQMKLRLVNGAHSQIAYLGAMAGWPTVDAAIARPELAVHATALLRDEMEPTLPPQVPTDREAYRAALMQRWRNPALAHRCQQIAMDGSHKIPQRWVRPLAERLAAHLPIDRLALGVAAWCHYLRGVDEAGAAYPIDDPMAETLRALQQRALALGDVRAEAREWLSLQAVFGPLAGHEALADAVGTWLWSLRERGVGATLRSLSG